MNIYIPLPGVLRFEKIYDGDESLQSIIHPLTMTIWEVDEGAEMEIRRILEGNNINFKAKKR